MAHICTACQKEVDGHRHAISCDVVSDGSIGFVGQVQHWLCGTGIYLFIYLFIYFVIIFVIIDFTLSSLYFQFQFLNNY